MEVRCGDTILIVDAGTGIRPLGRELERRGARDLHLLMSHTHWDHIQGFPFFHSIYSASTKLNIYSPREWSVPASAIFCQQMESPYFPVLMEDVPAKLCFHQVTDEFRIGEVEITRHRLNHPGGCSAFRFEYMGKSLVYATDHEPYVRLFGNLGLNRERDDSVRAFTRGADLLVRDAQYTEEEYENHRGWGHGTFEDAANDAIEARVRRLALFHHDPDHDDAFLESQLQALHRFASSNLEIMMAREGHEVQLA